MQLKYQSMDASFNFDKVIQIKSAPIKLITLTNFILEVINLSENSFSKESLASAQAIMFTFSLNRNGKSRSLKKKRHDQSKETPSPVYVTINIYSQSRSKTMINWLYFLYMVVSQYHTVGYWI